ncbi:hypothetical protein, partial [Actinobacillus pleuropneumoniae]|uniref:hypothetical protein n=1 Tax=Actinobacillus pleuropneumoniae TaxID=715 RepID=UPI00227D5565
ATKIQEIDKEFKLIQCQIQQQNARLSHIENHIPCLPQTELSGSNAKDLTPIESFDDYHFS